MYKKSKDNVPLMEQNRKRNVRWRAFLERRTLHKYTPEYIIENKDNMGSMWITISKHKELSEDMIRECQDYVCWSSITSCQYLSEDFIREFAHRTSWEHICACQHLSEDFIREFKEEVDWHSVSEFQNLSDEFKEEFKEELQTPRRR
jgi:hypothetical protein